MKLVPIDRWPAEKPVDYRTELESGNILYFPLMPFALPDESKEFLRNHSFAGGAIHKNIAYRTAADKITGIESDAALREQLRAIFRDYSRNVIQFVSKLLPAYARQWKLDYASFRPIEEEGRDLPLNKRNDLIHTDAFPSRPTNGDLILRVFTNISPAKTRVCLLPNLFALLRSATRARQVWTALPRGQTRRPGGWCINPLARCEALGFRWSRAPRMTASCCAFTTI
jgi:hypothetical protein